MSSFRQDHSYHRDLQESAQRIYNLLEAQDIAMRRRRYPAKCVNGWQRGEEPDRAEIGRLANAAGLNGPTQQSDTEIAHLTPGEIVVPLHAQTPAVMAALAKALGGSLPRYVMGSRRAQRNPVSGHPAFASSLPEEYRWAHEPMGWVSEAGEQIARAARVPIDAVGASGDLLRNYIDLQRARTKDADKYFHCKANYEAARRGPTAAAVAEWLSDAREWYGLNVKGDTPADSMADQAANRFGRTAARSGTYPTAQAACARFRPRGLPSKY